MAEAASRQRPPKRPLGANDADLTYRFLFEECVAQTCSRFVNPLDLDEAIRSSLADIGRFSRADRAYLFLLDESGLKVSNTHEWCAEGVDPQIGRLQALPADTFAWWMEKIRRGETIHIPDVSRMPPEAAAERVLLESQIIKSVLVLPVFIGGQAQGFIGFDNVLRSGTWTETDSALLRVLSEAIGAALERKRSQEALAQSERRYRDLFENANDYIYTHDLEGNFVSANPAALRAYGYTPEEISRINIADIVDPEHVPVAFRVIQEKVQGVSENRPFELKTYARDGMPIWVEVNVRLLERNGKPVGIHGIARDITARKKAEEALRHRMEFERLITAQSTAFINLPPEDIEKGITRALRNVGEFAGADRSYVALFDADPAKMSITHEWCAAGIEPQIANLQHVPIEPLEWCIRRLRRLEAVHIPRMSALPAEAAAVRELLEFQNIRSVVLVPMSYRGAFMGFIGFDAVRAQREWSEEDIALLKLVGEMIVNALVRKRTEERDLQRHKELAALGMISQTVTQSLDLDIILKQAIEKTAEMLNISHSGFYLFDEKQERLILKAHRGISDEEAEQIPPLDLADPNLAEMVRSKTPLFLESLSDFVPMTPAQTAAVIAENRLKSIMLVPLVSKGKVLGVMFAATQGERIFTPEERGLLVTVSYQVSAAIENAQLLKEASRAIALEETDRLRSAFLAAVSHELRTPITCIKGLASSLVLPDVAWDPETQRDFLQTIDRESDRLARIVSDILDMSKIEVGAMKLIKSEVTLQEIIGNLHAALLSVALNHRLTIRLEEGLPPVAADTSRIKQVIMNLIENAVGRSPQGSEITLDARRRDGALEVAVADRGESLPPEDAEGVFSPFYRIEDNTQFRRSGVGLKLAICKGIVESHGGRIWAESGRGAEGVTIRFTLPLSAA